MDREKVLLMFSGGLDSMLSAIRLIKAGYKVLLINFNNGCSLITGMVYDRALELELVFGKNRIEYIGNMHNAASFRENEYEVANMSFRYILDNYGDCTISQIRCLNCRSAMYYEAIRYCLENDIKFIAEGARKSQLFSIEQPEMIEAYRALLEEFGIELILPVYDVENEWDKENEIWRYGIVPTPGEDKCLFGMPLNEKVPLEQTMTVKNIFDNHIKPRYVRKLTKGDLPPIRISRERDGIKFD